MTTILVDPASYSARVSGVVCLGTAFDVQVTFEGGVEDELTDHAEIVVVLFSDANVALNITPALDAEYAGSIDLATDEAKALFVNQKPNDRVNVTVAVWNSTDRRMLGTGTITIKNNPFVFSSNSVNALLLAAFAARVATLEGKAGKVPHNQTGDWVGLYATGSGETQQLTFEATV